ncbi:MAG: hypothetical protein GXO64_01580 [Candidatus Micrarchaeota archaeon]|nr:hypothetical protein [Candidatus Micrarchaeota archaeon]
MEINEIFGDVLRIDGFLEKVDEKITGAGYNPQKDALIGLSICRDDNYRALRKAILTRYGAGYFSLETLGALLPSDITAYGAMSHHIPSEGIAVIMILPHIGIDKDGRVRFVERFGRKEPGYNCGAICNYLNSAINGNVFYDKRSDPEMALLSEAMEPFRNGIMEEYRNGDFGKAVIKATDHIYEISIERIRQLFKEHLKNEFEVPILLAGGIVVNTKDNDFIQLRILEEMK